MPLPFALLFASATATIGVSAYIPPHCGYAVSGTSLDAWCNAAHWSVVATGSDGSERIVWQGNGVGAVTLPASAQALYRLDLDY